jgi:hypothetical protein
VSSFTFASFAKEDTNKCGQALRLGQKIPDSSTAAWKVGARVQIAVVSLIPVVDRFLHPTDRQPKRARRSDSVIEKSIKEAVGQLRGSFGSIHSVVAFPGVDRSA